MNQFGAEVEVSLGGDKFKKETIRFFKLKLDEFLSICKLLENLQCPTFSIMKVRYDINELGNNAVNVLQAFEGQTQKSRMNL